MADDPEPRGLQLRKEAFVIESVLLRVLQDAAPERVRDEVAEDLFCMEPSAGTKDAVRFPKRGPPGRHVVHDPEIEDRIEPAGRRLDPGRIANP